MNDLEVEELDELDSTPIQVEPQMERKGRSDADDADDGDAVSIPRDSDATEVIPLSNEADGREKMGHTAEPEKTTSRERGTTSQISCKGGNKVVPDKCCRKVTRCLELCVFNGLAIAFFIYMFSAMGKGVKVFKKLLTLHVFTYKMGGFTFCIFFFLYIMDFSYWPAYMARFKHMLYTSAAVSLVLVSGLGAKEFPAAPLGMFFLLVPLYTYCIRKFVYTGTATANFIEALSYSLLLCSFVTFCAWVGWWTEKKVYWNQETKMSYSEQLGCDPPEDGNDSVCLVAYLLWISPFMAAIACFVFSMLCYFIAQTMFQQGRTNKKTVGMKAFAYFMMFSVLGVWVASGVAGAGMGLSNVFMAFVFLAFIIVGGIVGGTLGWDKMKENMLQIPLLQSLAATFLSDWVKAIGVFTCWFPFCMYMGVSFINQFIRKYISAQCCCGIAKKLEPKPSNESQLLLTAVCSQQVRMIMMWNWTSVWTKVVYIGLFFLTVNVGIGKLTTLFLSWLNGWLTDTFASSTGVVVVIFYLVGLTLFLLPPVPGVPVYLSGGVILVNILSPAPERDGFIGACLATCAVCFFIKLNAIAMQQKCFGEGMSNNLTVKCLVGVNSVTIKAIEKILRRPGLSIDKVCILCGGPDWPTSVLTGILKLRLSSMIFGSLPIIFLIAPCVFAGAFLLRANEGATWKSLSSVTLTLAALTQTMALGGAMYLIEQTVHDHRAELEAIPKDEEVALVEKSRHAEWIEYERITNWHNEVPRCMKAVLAMSGVFTTFACYLVLLAGNALGEECFETFEITDTIPEKLNGKALNLVKKYGWLAIGLMIFGIFMLKIFSRWASRKFKRSIAKNQVAPVAGLGASPLILAATRRYPLARGNTNPSLYTR
jgi:hypothetical protein